MATAAQKKPKECLSEGFEVQCFEARAELGGQWAQQPDVPLDGPEGASAAAPVQSSMYDGVVLNSCRDTSALPDFPIDPARYGDYYGHRLQLRYMHEYADHFGLVEHVQLNTRVLACEPRQDGSWSVRVQQQGRGREEAPQDLIFDAVFVCAGHLSSPSVPPFEGVESFKGQLLHSHYYRRPGPLERKKVAIIGFGSSAVDIACELAPGADEVHVISRRGAWVLPRYVLGKPTEAWDNRATQVWLPVSTAQWLQTKLLQFLEGEPPKVMQPKHKLLEQSPTIRSDFVEKVRTGAIVIHRGGVRRLTQDGIIISASEDDNAEGNQKEEEEELKVDVIMACTGYKQSDYPFLPHDVVRGPETPSKHVDLYKLIMSPRYPNLFMIGHAELVGPAAPVFDAQTRWACAVLSGRIQLPPQAQMRAEISSLHAWQDKHFVGSERHALALYNIQYADELLAPLGANPTFGRCLSRVFTSGHPWRALKVLNAVWFGIPSAAQWRLFGYGAKEELAVETVLRIAAGRDQLSQGEVRMLNLK
ncbi:FAD/NAD(P)-binding domain-containing protein [Cryphonectria parasitica EP155]|uniref:FAD/NAD(P)-binding domain-containing protein n=1 Tax=Cryphonectria parasitica (strain ATCC 38755 / EP155) TaxID=660469 RepID=A0A9P5CK01_CRYP1|nr:FAD/NAD(P)-binding domain-containing protein [Cryphonectria parasitica EP155]KAF3760446.1 FAD/NAD(P)-binding domain-containing protein [Cryphonectria parasitica EP155]